MGLTYGFCLGEAGAQYDSRQFSEAFHGLVGDGVCVYGGKFNLTVNGFALTLASGFALACGRWLKSDEPIVLTAQPSSNTYDRYDAVAVTVEYATRKTTVGMLVDVDPAAIRQEPALIRNAKTYSVILYLIRVKRGTTNLYPGDVTDTRGDAALCGYIAPISAESANVLYINKFLTSGIDEEVARMIGLSREAMEKADQAIANMDAAIQATSGNDVGEILISKNPPSGSGPWLLCNGGTVPPQYTELSAILGGTLPTIVPADTRFQAYIYGGWR